MSKMDISFIIGDSRVAGMRILIEQINHGSRHIRAVKCSGKGIRDLTTKVIKITEHHPSAHVIIAGGIYDFTERNEDTSNLNEKFIFKYFNVMPLCEHLHSLFIDSCKELKRLRPLLKVSYSELIGMNLEKIACTKDPIHGQQNILNEAIMMINPKIVRINEENSVPTPWIAKRVHVNRKNGSHHQYERLSDGIHLSDELKFICAQKFVDTLYKMQ